MAVSEEENSRIILSGHTDYTDITDAKKMDDLFVGVKEIDYIETQIDTLCDKYNNRRGSDFKQQRALFRSYCHDTIKVFDECFATSLLGMIRCKAKVEAYQTKDDIDFGKATLDIVNMLWDLKKIVRTMVPIKDLPSCKKLIELSPEDIVSKAKDLVKSDIIKAGIGTLLLGSKISDIVNIEDVKSYYSERLSQLQDEIKIKGGMMSPIEQFLLDKFNAEIGYCNIALFKAGIGISKELRELVDIGRKHIDKYETELAQNREQFQGKYI